AVAERLIERLADADAHVLDGVMRTGLKIAGRRDAEVKVPVARQQIEHVVQESDTRLALSGTVAVERETDANVGLLGLAIDFSGSGHPWPLSRMRASIDRACCSKPSARAIGAARRASSPAAAPIRTSLKRRRKCAGDSPEEKRAAPPVG